MSLLSLIGRLSLNTDGFEAGLKKAESATSAFSSKLVAGLGAAAAAAFSVAAVKGMIDSINEAAIEVSQLAKQYQLTTDEVQTLQKATGRLGLGFDNVAGAIGRIQKARAIAMGGGEQGQKSLGLFAELGVKSGDVLNPMKSVVDVMKDIATNSEKGGKSAGIQRAEFELLGKNAIVLKSVMTEIKNLGPVHLFDSNEIQDALDAMRELKRAESERKIAMAPIAAGWNRGVAAGSKTLTAGWEEMKSTMSPFSLLGGLIASPIDFLAEAFAGGLSRSGPDPERIERLNKKKALQKYGAGRQYERVENTSAGVYSAIAPGSGSLAGIGGFAFGDGANQEIIKNTKRSAFMLEEIKRDTQSLTQALNSEVAP
jgi:hypothetical protein